MSAVCCASIDSRSPSSLLIWSCTDSSSPTLPACASSARSCAIAASSEVTRLPTSATCCVTSCACWDSDSWVPSPAPDSVARVAWYDGRRDLERHGGRGLARVALAGRRVLGGDVAAGVRDDRGRAGDRVLPRSSRARRAERSRSAAGRLARTWPSRPTWPEPPAANPLAAPAAGAPAAEGAAEAAGAAATPSAAELQPDAALDELDELPEQPAAVTAMNEDHAGNPRRAEQAAAAGEGTRSTHAPWTAPPARPVAPRGHDSAAPALVRQT